MQSATRNGRYSLVARQMIQSARHAPGKRRPLRAGNLLELLERRVLFSAGYTLQALAKLGDPAPGPEGGVFTFDFEPGRINERGQVVFTADLAQPPDLTSDAGEGIFIANADGTITKLARVGETSPGGGGVFSGFGSLSQDDLNNQGDATFAYTLNGANIPSPNSGVWRYSHATGQLTPVEVPGVTPAPGGGTFQGANFSPSINNRGDIAFVGVIATTMGFNPASGLGEGIFEQHPNGQIVKLVAPGDPAPGGSTFDSAQFTSINDRGDVAFGAHIAGDPSLGGDGTGLGSFQSVYLRRADGTILSLGHQGDAIPASAGGGVFDAVYAPKVNYQGDVAFAAGLRTNPPQANAVNDPQGVFFYSKGRLVAVARPGQSMPGGGTLVTISSSGDQVGLNNGGQVVFAGLLSTGEEGVYAWRNGVLTLVAKTGTTLADGSTITGDQYGGSIAFWTVNNDRGQIAFAADLNGDGGGALIVATPRGDASDNGSPGGPAPHAFAPDAIVKGQSVAQWAANWWTQVFQTPLHAADGSDLNPVVFDDGPSAQGNVGGVFYLYGSFFGGNHTHTATVPAGTPIFVPILPIEFSNFDTTTGNVAGGTLPGNNTAAQLSDFAAQAAVPALTPPGGVHLTLDGHALPNATSYREIAPTFSYVLPATDNVDQFFFGQSNLQGPVSPAEADGFYVMLQPLTPGRHVLDFGGMTPGGSLGPLDEDVTYTINVVPKGQLDRSTAGALAAVNAAAGNTPAAPLVDSVSDLFDKLRSA